MFFIYFSCALIASIFVYLDSVKQQLPFWWGPLVFFAPVTTPFYIIKTIQKKSIILITIFTVVSILVGIGEFLLFSRISEKIEFESYSPASQEIIRFTDKLRYIVTKMNYYTVELENSTSVSTSVTGINEAVAFCGAMKSLMKENQRSLKRLSLMANDYRNLLIAEKLNWILDLDEFYSEKFVIKYLKSLDNYLDTFEALLKYTGKYFEEIQMKSAWHRKNYDGYYMNYARALDRHSRVNVGRMRYQHNFVVHHPELESYLPNVLDNRFFKIWSDKP